MRRGDLLVVAVPRDHGKGHAPPPSRRSGHRCSEQRPWARHLEREPRDEAVAVGSGDGATLWAMAAPEKPGLSPAEVNKSVRVRRVREDARRPASVNLAETIALSHALIEMADVGKRR